MVSIIVIETLDLPAPFVKSSCASEVHHLGQVVVAVSDLVVVPNGKQRHAFCHVREAAMCAQSNGCSNRRYQPCQAPRGCSLSIIHLRCISSFRYRPALRLRSKVVTVGCATSLDLLGLIAISECFFAMHDMLLMCSHTAVSCGRVHPARAACGSCGGNCSN